MFKKLTFLLLSVWASQAFAQKRLPFSPKAVKMESPFVRANRIENLERRISPKVQNLPSGQIPRNKTTTSGLAFVDLGKSINPYTGISAGRNYLAVDNASQTIALFRRGGPDDGPTPQGPGNRIYVDVNTRGGQENKWQLGRKLLMDNRQLPGGTPTTQMLRFPEGVVYNPSASADTNNIRLFGMARVLDESNGPLWGGLSRGWGVLSNPPNPLKQTYWTSDDETKMFNPTSLVTTPGGNIFAVYPEVELTSADAFFQEKVLVMKYNYDSPSNSFDSTIIVLPFLNPNPDTLTEVRDAQIEFSPDGQTGYVFITAFNPGYRNKFGMIPFYSKSTDGGNTWSGFTMIDFNKTPAERPYLSPDKDNFRNQMFGNYVRFVGDSIIASSGLEPFSHAVDYTLMEVDLTVDKFGLPHLMGTMAVIGFDDTLLTEGPSFFRPGFGSWTVDIYVDPAGVSRGIVLSANKGFITLYGDPDIEDDQFREFNRPTISRSQDGSMVSFGWCDTDPVAHPISNPDFTNQNPDFFNLNFKTLASGQFLRDTIRNLTKDSDFDGLANLHHVAPTLLSTTQSFELPLTIMFISDYPGDPAIWPVTHLYAKNIVVDPTVCVTPIPGLDLTETEDLKKDNQGLKGWNLYPNPAKSWVELKFSQSYTQKVEIQVLNALGRQVKSGVSSESEKNGSFKVNLEGFDSGIYLIRALSETESRTWKVIKK